ncbi:hypothetical protein D3C85_1637750 [compost metagenome]
MAMQNIQRNPAMFSISDITVAVYSHGKCFAGLGDDMTEGVATQAFGDISDDGQLSLIIQA